jgi:hypothetical protein
MSSSVTKQIERQCRRQNGSVLVLAIFVVLVSLVIGTGLLTMGTQVRLFALDRIQDTMARSAADAGLEYAVQQINNAVTDKTWSSAVLPSVEDVPLFDSDSTYSVVTQYHPANGYTILSTGTNRNRTRIVTASLRLKGLFDMAVQCRNNVVLKNGTRIDAIDSSISLNPEDTNEKAMVGTNSIEAGSIVLNNNVIVDGDVVVGVGGDVMTVIKDLGGVASDRYSLSAELEFPPVSAPALVGPDTGIQIAKDEMTIGAGGDFPAVGRFSEMKLKNGTVLRVIDNCTLYITGDIEMGQSSEIIIDSAANASLTIYLNGSWVSGNDAGVTNTTSSASAFQLYGLGETGQIIDIKAKGDLFGSIYAPNAILTVFSGGDLYGAFVADSFELKNPARFFYDTVLQDITVNEEGARYIINRWNEQ